MKRGGNAVLEYNLCPNEERTLFRGDCSGGSSMMTVGKNQSANLSIICNTPEGQDPEAGSYADIILISVEF